MVHPGNLGGQQTFRFATMFPNLKMPARQVVDPNMVNPSHADCLLDGEWVKLGQASGSAHDLATRFANKLVAGDLPSVDTGGGAGAYVLSQGNVGAKPESIAQVHFRRGQSDNQAARAVPTVEDENYEFYSRLIDDSVDYNDGDLCIAQVIANGDLPASVQSYTSRDVIGTLPIKELAGVNLAGNSDAGIAGQILHAVAVVIQGKDSKGYVRFKRVNRPVSLPA